MHHTVSRLIRQVHAPALPKRPVSHLARGTRKQAPEHATHRTRRPDLITLAVSGASARTAKERAAYANVIWGHTRTWHVRQLLLSLAASLGPAGAVTAPGLAARTMPEPPPPDVAR